jgi:hypothetical protein
LGGGAVGPGFSLETLRGPTGALIVGDAEAAVEKILYIDKALGGISRLNFQMSAATLSHERLMHSIEVLGTKVAPVVRKELAGRPPLKLLRSRHATGVRSTHGGEV